MQNMRCKMVESSLRQAPWGYYLLLLRYEAKTEGHIFAERANEQKIWNAAARDKWEIQRIRMSIQKTHYMQHMGTSI